MQTTLVRRLVVRTVAFTQPHLERVLGESLGPGTRNTSAEDGSPGGAVHGRTSRSLPMGVNAIALMLNWIVGSALGYPFWLMAARLFDQTAVGLGSGAVSAMRLCSQVGLLGTGAAIILLLPGGRQQAGRLVTGAFMLAGVTGAIASAGFLFLADGLFHELSVLVSSSGYVLAFLLMNTLLMVSLVFDSTFTALQRSDKVLTRSIVQGLAAAAVLGSVGLLTDLGGVLAILLAWAAALLASSLLGHIQLRSCLPEYQFRPTGLQTTTRSLLAVGLPNSALNLAGTAPILILPIAMTEVLGPATNAIWYAVWMLGSLVRMIPVTASNALFAEATNRPALVHRSMRQSIRLCLTLGVPTAGVMMLIAPWGLHLMGEGYAHAGVTPLRIVVLGVIPQTLIAVYVTRQRAVHQTLEPTVFNTITGVLAVVGAVAAGTAYGLTGVALAWLSVECLAGLWAAGRLRRVANHRQSVVDAASMGTKDDARDGRPEDRHYPSDQVGEAARD